MPFEIDRSLYARMYGPTVGDRVRLGDTNLLVEVERDEASPGDETLRGFGKTIRSPRTCRSVGADDGPALDGLRVGRIVGCSRLAARANRAAQSPCGGRDGRERYQDVWSPHRGRS